nr:hypothetical protein [Tanacetum cinerariifolium]
MSLHRNHQRRDTTRITPTLVSSSQTPEFDYCAKTVRIIPGPAGIVQDAKRLKRSNIREGGHEGVMPTQEYIRKLIEEVGIVQDAKCLKRSNIREGGHEGVMPTQEYIRKLIEEVGDDGFTHSTVEYVNVEGGIASGSFNDMKTNCQNGKLTKDLVTGNDSGVGGSGVVGVTKEEVSTRLGEES